MKRRSIIHEGGQYSCTIVEEQVNSQEMCTERIDLQVCEVQLHVNVVVEAQNELRDSAAGVRGGERIDMQRATSTV